MTSSTSLAESRRYSLLKAFSWRLLATTTTILVGWWITGQTQLALEIGLADTLIKIGLFYTHERAWLRLDSPSVAL